MAASDLQLQHAAFELWLNAEGEDNRADLERSGAAGKIVTPNGTVLSCDLDVEPETATGIGYISHWSTCPQAGRLRKREAKP